MPISGTIEFAHQMGFFDSDLFTSSSALSAHILRVLATDVNHLTTQQQVVFRQTFSAVDRPQFPASVIADTHEPGAFYQPLYNYWVPIQPPTIVPKQPGIIELDLHARLQVTQGRVIALQVTTKAKPFSSDPDAILIITGSASGSDSGWMHVTGTVACHAEGEEEVAVYARGFIDPNFDSTFQNATSESPFYYTGIVSSSFDPGAYGPGRFTPTPQSVVNGFSDVGISNRGPYVQFYESGSNRPLSGPHIIVSSSGNPPTLDYGLRFLHFLPPAETDLRGSKYIMYQAPLLRVASIALFTKRRTR